jgi:hypothetical protein
MERGRKEDREGMERGWRITNIKIWGQGMVWFAIGVFSGAVGTGGNTLIVWTWKDNVNPFMQLLHCKYTTSPLSSLPPLSSLLFSFLISCFVSPFFSFSFFPFSFTFSLYLVLFLLSFLLFLSCLFILLYLFLIIL